MPVSHAAPVPSISKDSENELRKLIAGLQGQVSGFSSLETQVSSLKREVASLTAELQKEKDFRKKWMKVEQDRAKSLASLM